MDGSLSMEMDMDVDYGISPPSNPDPLDQNQTPDINPPLPGASTAASAEKDIEEPVLPPRSTMTVFDSIMTHIDLDAVLNCALAIITTPPKSDEDQIALVREIMAILNLDTDSEGAASYQSLHAIIRDISTMVVGLLVMIFGDQNSQPDEKGDLAARFASQFGDDKIHGTPRQGSGEKDDKDATEAAVRRCCWGLFEHQQLFVDAEYMASIRTGGKELCLGYYRYASEEQVLQAQAQRVAESLVSSTLAQEQHHATVPTQLAIEWPGEHRTRTKSAAGTAEGRLRGHHGMLSSLSRTGIGAKGRSAVSKELRMRSTKMQRRRKSKRLDRKLKSLELAIKKMSL